MGNDLNNCRDKTDTPEQCQELCQKTPGCVQFTWLDSNFHEDSRFKQCCMKNKLNSDYIPTTGLISGPKRCSKLLPFRISYIGVINLLSMLRIICSYNRMSF